MSVFGSKVHGCLAQFVPSIDPHTGSQQHPHTLKVSHLYNIMGHMTGSHDVM